MSVDNLVQVLDYRFARMNKAHLGISSYDIRKHLDSVLSLRDYANASQAVQKMSQILREISGQARVVSYKAQFVGDLDDHILEQMNNFAPSGLRTLSSINKDPKKKILYGLDLVQPSKYLSALVSQLSDPEKIYFFTGLFCRRTNISQSLQHKVAQFCEVGRNHLLKLHTRRGYTLPELGNGSRHYGDVVLDYNFLLHEQRRFAAELKNAKSDLFGLKVLRSRNDIQESLDEAMLQKQAFLESAASEEKRILTLVFGEKELGNYAVSYNPKTIVP